MKLFKMMIMLLTLGCALFFVTACDTGDKKAETFGEKVDEAIDDTRDAVDDAADEASDKIEDTCEKASDKNC